MVFEKLKNSNRKKSNRNCYCFRSIVLYLVFYRKYDDTRGCCRPAGDLFDPTDGFAEGDGEPGGHPDVCRALEPAPLLSVAPAAGQRDHRMVPVPHKGNRQCPPGIYHRFPHNHF